MKNYSDSEDFELSTMVESDGEFIPLISEEDENEMNTESIPSELPILSL